MMSAPTARPPGGAIFGSARETEFIYRMNKVTTASIAIIARRRPQIILMMHPNIIFVVHLNTI
jgi:hypothetical protein